MQPMYFCQQIKLRITHFYGCASFNLKIKETETLDDK